MPNSNINHEELLKKLKELPVRIEEFNEEYFKTIASLVTRTIEKEFDMALILRKIKSFSIKPDILNFYLTQAISLISLDLQKQHELSGKDSPVADVKTFESLTDFVHDSLVMKLIDNEYCQLYFDPVLLCEANLTSTNDVQEFNKRARRINTSVYYKQRKFNLISECLVGFSNLINALGTYIHGTNEISNEEFKERVLSLIGKYSLDPNRVLFLLFDVLSTDNKEKEGVLLEFIKEIYPKETILQSLAFSLSNFASEENLSLMFKYISSAISNSVDEDTKKQTQSFFDEQGSSTFDLFKVVTLMLENNVVAENDIIEYLPLFSSDMTRYLELKFQYMKLKRKNADTKKYVNLCFGYLLQSSFRVHLICFYFKRHEYQKGFDFIEALNTELNGYYIESLEIIQDSLNVYFVSLLSNESIDFKDLEFVLQYLKYNMNVESLEKFVDYLAGQEFSKQQLYIFFVEIIFPTISRIKDMNADLEVKLFDLLKKNFDYNERYNLYADVDESRKKLEDIYMKEYLALNLYHTKQILKKVSNTKEAMLLASSQLKGILQIDCLTCIQYLLNNIQIYDNLSKLFISTLNISSDFNFDIISYLLIKNISLIQNNVKLSALAKFIGYFYQKYYYIEIQGLLNFILHSLGEGNISIVLVVEELFDKMGEIIILDNISMSTILALGGSKLLRSLSKVSKSHELGMYLDSSSTRVNKKVLTLKTILLEKNYVLALIFHMINLREKVVVDREYHKLDTATILTNYDKITQVLLQIIEFLKAELTFDEYYDLFSDFDTLSLQYHINPTLFFMIIRPILHKSYLNRSENDKFFLFSTHMQNAYVKLALANDGQVIKDKGYIKLELLFNTFSMYFLTVPGESYRSQTKKIEDILKAKRANRLSKRDVTKLESTKTQLSDDLKQHEIHLTDFMSFIEKLDITLEDENKYSKRCEVIWKFLNHSVIERCLLTPEGAVYCGTFIVFFVNMCQGFNFNIVVKCLPLLLYRVYCSTEREAKNFAIFLKKILSHASQLRMSQEHFDEWDNSVDKGDDDSIVSMDYETFKLEMEKVYSKFTKLIAEFLGSKNDSLIRAILIIATEITDDFPSSVTDATRLKVAVNSLLNENNDQTKIMAKRYMALLQQQIKKGTLKGVTGASTTKVTQPVIVSDTMSVESGEIDGSIEKEDQKNPTEKDVIVIDNNEPKSNDRKRKPNEDISSPKKRQKQNPSKNGNQQKPNSPMKNIPRNYQPSNRQTSRRYHDRRQPERVSDQRHSRNNMPMNHPDHPLPHDNRDRRFDDRDRNYRRDENNWRRYERNQQENNNYDRNERYHRSDRRYRN